MIDIRPFGPGYRRTDAPPQCTGLFVSVIVDAPTVFVAELHFEPDGERWEHAADHPILFIATEGEGRVRVGGDEARLCAGQAVMWPPRVPHKLWAETRPFTGIVVEYNMPEPV